MEVDREMVRLSDGERDRSMERRTGKLGGICLSGIAELEGKIGGGEWWTKGEFMDGAGWRGWRRDGPEAAAVAAQ